MTPPPGPGRNPHKVPVGEDRWQIQQYVYSNLKKVPGVTDVRFEESGTGVEHQIVGDIDTAVYADGVTDASAGKVQINWWPLHDEQDRHWHEYHYYESSGFDCGWHRHEHSHGVDGLNHYQERASTDEEYEYYEANLTHGNPVGILWEILGDRLVERMKIRHSR